MERKRTDGTTNNCDFDLDVEAIERAMVAIRRSQRRRSLAGRDAKRIVNGGGESTTGVRARPDDATVDVLDVLEAAEQTGVEATVATVAVALSVDPPRASKLVAAAVEAGLVQRAADQQDGRRSLLAPTDAGRALIKQVHQFRCSVFASAMSDWPDTDRNMFAQSLTRFVEALSRPPNSR